MKKISHSIAMSTLFLTASAAAGALAADNASAPKTQRCGLRDCSSQPPPPPQGSCQPSSSLTVLVTGTNVVAYVPKGNWESGAPGIGAVNVEGSSISNTLVATPNVVNSCASNALTGTTVCVANNTDVYLLTGTTLSSTLSSNGSGVIGFWRRLHQLQYRHGCCA